MRAEVIAIGDELTTGQRLDTNSQWLSRHLTELGVDVAFHTTVGDELEDMVGAFRLAIERAEVVVVTGGLGPTADDLTREALAEATGVGLVRDEASLAHICNLFARRGREMPKRNERQADFPAGAIPIPNLNGTAPGIKMTVERDGQQPCTWFALPGVPVEMHEMWQATVARKIASLQGDPRVIRHRRIKCFGVGESQLEAMLPDLIRRDRKPRVGITVSDATITLRITAAARDEAACLAAIEPTEATIRHALGKIVFGEEDDELEHAVLRLLKAQNLTLATAEWATAGLAAEWLRAASGRSQQFRGGTVVERREMVAGLTEGDAEYAPTVAMQLAESARESTGADIGLGIGAFPPDKEQADSRVYIGLALPSKTRKFFFPCAAHPSIVKSRTAKQALNALRLVLLGDAADHPN